MQPPANSAPIHDDERLAEIVRVRAEIAAAELLIEFWTRHPDDLLQVSAERIRHWRGVRDTWERVLARLALPEQDGA